MQFTYLLKYKNSILFLSRNFFVSFSITSWQKVPCRDLYCPMSLTILTSYQGSVKKDHHGLNEQSLLCCSFRRSNVFNCFITEVCIVEQKARTYLEFLHVHCMQNSLIRCLRHITFIITEFFIGQSYGYSDYSSPCVYGKSFDQNISLQQFYAARLWQPFRHVTIIDISRACAFSYRCTA